MTNLSQHLEAAIDSEATLLLRIDAADHASEEIRHLMKNARVLYRRRDTARAAEVCNDARAVYDAWFEFDTQLAHEEKRDGRSATSEDSGLYPDGSKPKDPFPLTPRPTDEEVGEVLRQQAERIRKCENCGKSGGTLVAISNDQFVHDPDCQYAAASRARMEHRQNEYDRKLRRSIVRARRLLRDGPQKAEPETPEEETKSE